MVVQEGENLLPVSCWLRLLWCKDNWRHNGGCFSALALVTSVSGIQPSWYISHRKKWKGYKSAWNGFCEHLLEAHCVAVDECELLELIKQGMTLLKHLWKRSSTPWQQCLSLSLRCRGCLFTKPSFHTSLENKRDKECYWCNCFCELHWSRSSIWAGEYPLYLIVYKQLCGAFIVYCINLLRCRLRFSDSKKEKMLHFTKFVSNRTISEEYSVCCAVLCFTSLIM